MGLAYFFLFIMILGAAGAAVALLVLAWIIWKKSRFKISMMPGALDVDLPLEDIRGFSVSGVAIFTQVTIHSWKGETYLLW